MADPFVHRLRVRYGECDPQGVVFNAHYFAYFDVAFTELWRAALGRYDEFVAGGLDLVVAEAGARFLVPAAFDDELDVGFAIDRIGESSLSSSPFVARDGVTLVEGTMRHVCIDVGRKTKAPLPERVRAALAPYAGG